MRIHVYNFDSEKNEIMAKKLDIILKPSGRVLSLFGCNHSRVAKTKPAASQTLYNSLLDSSPSCFLVETTRKSLDLSIFVWESRDTSLTHEKFCVEESEFVETPAIAAADKLGILFSSIVPIDVDSFKTRKNLAIKMLLHPIESLILISRYHNAPSDDVDINEWRNRFRASCPTAFSILFTERERHMAEIISAHVKASQGDVAVLVGLSHLEALHNSLIDHS